MNKIYIIATNTIRELIRDRIMYGILVFAVLLIFLSLISAQLSYVERTRITMDLGLAGLELSVVILSIFLGATVVFREIEKRTVFTLFTKPIDRWQFLVGKFLGLVSLVLLLLFLLSLLFLTLLLLLKWQPDFQYFYVMVGFGLEAMVLIAITIVLGVMVRPTLTVPITIGIFLIGKSMSSLVFFMNRPDAVFYKYFANTIRFLFPDFSRFDWKGILFQDSNLAFSELGISILYCITWILIFNSIAVIVFKDKDIG